jgi:hypothetical protein
MSGLVSGNTRYGVVGLAAGSIEQYVYYHLPIRSYSLKDTPEDGPMRSKTL